MLLRNRCLQNTAASKFLHSIMKSWMVQLLMTVLHLRPHASGTQDWHGRLTLTLLRHCLSANISYIGIKPEHQRTELDPPCSLE